MPRYKAQQRNGLLVPVVLSEQLAAGSFAFALQYLVDTELDLSTLDARYRNESVGASADDPQVLLKIVLLAYSQGIVSSRAMERACAVNVQFMAISGDAQPGHSVLAAFVSGMGEQVKAVFSQVLMVCDAQGLIGRQMFAIDGVKLPCNASKERSGTHAELLHRAQRLERAAGKIVAEHQAQDKQADPGQPMPALRQRRIEALSAEARRTREFVATRARRALRAQCLRTPGRSRRSLHVQSSVMPDPNHPGDRMRAAVDSPQGRRLYSQRMGTVEPVFANIRHNKRLNRFHLRGKAKVNTQQHLYCVVHNIEELPKAGIGAGKAH